MFRSLGHSSASGSGSDSSPDEQHELASPPDEQQTSSYEEFTVREWDGVPLHREGTASESILGNGDAEESDSQFPQTAEQHATLLLSSLLEFVYNVRAAEHLNYAHAHNSFHRESPEARELGARMYQGCSSILASNGIVADCVHDEGWNETRQKYLIGIDNLGLQVLNESLSPKSISSAKKPAKDESDVSTYRTSQILEEPLYDVKSVYLPERLIDLEQYRANIAALVHRLKIPAPFAELQLAVPPSAARLNRYKADFCELKQIGKGGFGSVYHVKNFVDNQDYAVKKIPLDLKLFRRCQSGSPKEVEELLKEIRTLARLEHSNVVRYYAAWIEAPDGPRAQAASESTPRQPHRKQLPLSKWQAESLINGGGNSTFLRSAKNLAEPISKNSDGIVFAEDSNSSGHNYDGLRSKKPGLCQELHNNPKGHDQPTSTASSVTETDIFTDGDGALRPRDTGDEVPSAERPTVLYIQMSLHPLSLSAYLTPSSCPIGSRHCFHLPPSVNILSAILSGVEHLHARRIVHRDIKPGNIFLSEHGEYDARPGCIDTHCNYCEGSKEKQRFLNPRIGDFGLVADLSGALSGQLGVQVPSSTSSSRAIGTEFYRPPAHHHFSSSKTNGPAQPQGQPINENLDVFALGIVFFELLWPMDTKMERHILLTNLSRNSHLPANFATKIDPNATPFLSSSLSCLGGDDGDADEDSRHDGRAGSHACDSSTSPVTIGQAVQECIESMVCASPDERWSCQRVRMCLNQILESLSSRPCSSSLRR